MLKLTLFCKIGNFAKNATILSLLKAINKPRISWDWAEYNYAKSLSCLSSVGSLVQRRI